MSENIIASDVWLGQNNLKNSGAIEENILSEINMIKDNYDTSRIYY